MTALTQTLKLRASSAAFIQGRTVYTDFSTGCLRNLLFASYGMKEKLKAETSDRGARNEDRFIERLETPAGVDSLRELNSPVHEVIPGVAWGGRSDLVFRGHIPADGAVKNDTLAAVYELKSTGSKNKLRDLKTGKYTTENLAQLVAYMLDFEIGTGYLVYSYYEPDKVTGEDTLKYERSFKVTFDSIGTVIVDSKPTMFNVADQLAHRLQAAEVLLKNLVWDRPHNWDATWGSPCHFCPFKRACDKYDNHEIADADGLLLEAAKLVPVRRD